MSLGNLLEIASVIFLSAGCHTANQQCQKDTCFCEMPYLCVLNCTIIGKMFLLCICISIEPASFRNVYCSFVLEEDVLKLGAEQ